MYGVDRDSVGDLELAGFGALAAPKLDELAVLVEFEDAGILRYAAPSGSGRVALRDEQVSVGGDSDVIRFIKKMRFTAPLARLALGPERQKDLAIVTQLHDGVRADVGGPDVSVLIDTDSVAPGE